MRCHDGKVLFSFSGHFPALWRSKAWNCFFVQVVSVYRTFRKPKNVILLSPYRPIGNSSPSSEHFRPVWSTLSTFPWPPVSQWIHVSPTIRGNRQNSSDRAWKKSSTALQWSQISRLRLLPSVSKLNTHCADWFLKITIIKRLGPTHPPSSPPSRWGQLVELRSWITHFVFVIISVLYKISDSFNIN